MGANDTANSYGTSVGAGVLKLWQAYALATVFETAGAVLLGYKVTDFFRKSVIDTDMYSVYSLEYGNGSCDTCWTELNQTTYTNCINSTSANNYFNPSIPLSNTSSCEQFTSAQFMIGSAGALLGASIWMLIATLTKLPVSTTQSAMGATVGFSLVIKGFGGIHQMAIIKTVLSWVISPVMSGTLGIIFYSFTRLAILDRRNSFSISIMALPFYYATVTFVVVVSVLFSKSKYLHFNDIPNWACLTASFGIAIGVAIIIKLFIQEKVKNWVLNSGIEEIPIVAPFYTGVPELKNSSAPTTIIKSSVNPSITLVGSPITTQIRKPSDSGNDSGVTLTPASGAMSPTTSDSPNTLESTELEAKTLFERNSNMQLHNEPVAASKVFSSLQIMSACLIAFVHGSNDVANSAGNLMAIWVTYRTGYVATNETNDPTYLLIIVYAALTMVFGLWILGHKVIETVGRKITDITPACGFCMEMATALTVLLCSNLAIPVSTTHCAVGAVIAVGYYRTRSVKWKVFGNIAIAWLVTVPIAMMLSAFFTFIALKATNLTLG